MFSPEIVGVEGWKVKKGELKVGDIKMRRVAAQHPELGNNFA